MRTISAIAAAAVLYLGLASGGHSATGNVGVNSSSEGVNNSAGGGNAAVRNPAGGGNTAINGANSPLTPGESANHGNRSEPAPLNPVTSVTKGSSSCLSPHHPPA
jgi:hypothetical protein